MVNMWIWICGVVVVIAIIACFVFFRNRKSEEEVRTSHGMDVLNQNGYLMLLEY